MLVLAIGSPCNVTVHIKKLEPTIRIFSKQCCQYQNNARTHHFCMPPSLSQGHPHCSDFTILHTYNLTFSPIFSYSCFDRYPESAEAIAPAMNNPRAGWNKVGHSGSHESIRVVAPRTDLSPRPATNHANMNKMKKKSATKTFSITVFANPSPSSSTTGVLLLRWNSSVRFSRSLFWRSRSISCSMDAFCKNSLSKAESVPFWLSSELSSFLHKGTFFSPPSSGANALTCTFDTGEVSWVRQISDQRINN